MHEHLDALGLIHMNGRIYDPAIGRFMSADPGVPHPLDIQSFNRYSYTRNNPLVYVDPDGFYDEEYDSYSQCYCISGTTYDYSSQSNYYGNGYSVDYNQYTGTQTTTYYNQYGSGLDVTTTGTYSTTSNSPNVYVNSGTAGASDQSYQIGQGADATLSMIPGVEFGRDSVEAFKDGRYGTGTLYAVAAAADIGTLGGAAKTKTAWKVSEEIAILGKGHIDPSLVRFTQDSIKGTFKNGNSISDLADALRADSGKALAKAIEPIRLVVKDGLLYTLDNRRLAAFAAAGREVPYRMATAAEIAKEWATKFTTTVEQGWGKYITIRGAP
jgi:RHS repeat-associated protein